MGSIQRAQMPKTRIGGTGKKKKKLLCYMGSIQGAHTPTRATILVWTWEASPAGSGLAAIIPVLEQKKT